MDDEQISLRPGTLNRMRDFGMFLEAAERRKSIGDRGFAAIAIELKRWLKICRAVRDGDPPVKVTIEVANPQAAAAMLCALKNEFDVMTLGYTSSIELDESFRLMGMDFTFSYPKRGP